MDKDMHERALRGFFFATLLLVPACSEADSTHLLAVDREAPSSELPGAGERPSTSTGVPSGGTASGATPGVETAGAAASNGGTPGAGSGSSGGTAGGATGGATPGSTGVETVVEPVLPAPGPIFAVPSEVYGADFATSNSYIPLVPSLDVERIEINRAREVTGRASVAAIGPWLFVASSSAPVVERFELAPDGSLREAGRISFMNYGLPEFFAIDAWGAVFISPEKAYLFNGNDGSQVIWNPTTLEITGEIPGPGISRMGYSFESVVAVRGNRMYRIFTLLNYEAWEFPPAPQYLAVYDLTTDTLINTVEESRCPQLYSRPFIDERGDIYFSGWVWTPGLTLTSDYPASCALRVLAGQDTFDPSWQLDFAAEVTQGREAAVMRYLGGGKALLDVFHAERATIVPGTDPQELSNTPNWRLWSIDLESKTGAPVEGLDFRAGGYQDVEVGGRTFLMVPNDSYSETTALEVVDGHAAPRFVIQGSAYHMVKLR
ncbi:MAG: hypothetical protein RL033_2594 [Pseudomonadota bacterium]|jgi:hypothetical protein